MLVEILLQLLVGKVDVELFESIDLKVFKSKDIQYADEGKVIFSSFNACIDLLQDPAKEVGIQSHGSRVSGVPSLSVKWITET